MSTYFRDRPSAIPYDIVCFSIINWEFRWQRPQQMMALWARRGRRVFYLRISDFLPPDGKPFAVKPLAANVWEVRIALPKGFSFHSGKHPDGFATVGLEALRALREQFKINRALAVVQFASWTPLACAGREAFGWPLVYDCMDDWSTFPGLSECRPLLAWEEELLKTADRVVVSSRTIQERWADRRTDLLLARNAADFAFFQATPPRRGEDPLPGVAGPIAGFFGAIAEWFDRDLMVSVAKARPDVTFVLVGGVYRISVTELEKLPNVRFEGQQPYEKMPLYLRRFDVCLVPFEVSPATNGMDVVKLYEYFSQGKPVVATPIREILIYDALLYLAEDAQGFVRQLDRALNENDPTLRARRIELARQNTWDERLDRIEARMWCVLQHAWNRVYRNW
jgi:glycosyltransferase involved in cell wall biosynthesis